MKKQILLLIFFFCASFLYAQSSLWGNIWDKESMPFAFAKVTCESRDGFLIHTIADADGYYRIALDAGTYDVTFSAVGYKDFRVDSLVVGLHDDIKLDAILLDDDSNNEVVLISRISPTDKKNISIDAQTFSPKLVPPPPPPPRKYASRKIIASHDAKAPPASTMSDKPSTIKSISDIEVTDDVKLEETVVATGLACRSADARFTPGTLTAGEINDFSKWNLWDDKNQRNLTSFRTQWWIYPSKRFSVIVQNQEGFAVVDQEVILMNSLQEKIWVARTDNLGRAELWANMFDEKHWGNGHFSILVKTDKKTYTVSDATLFKNGVNHLKINKICDVSDVVDVAFVVDATGSMDDEIHFLKAELKDVIERVQEEHEALEIRLSSVFYRDQGEDYLTKKSDFSSDVSKTVSFIRNQNASGGGDEPEAVEAALEVAIDSLDWSNHARTKLLFLVLDAPPHTHGDVLSKLNKIIINAAKKGIRIIPITGSGIDKNTEYLMRCLSLSTNGSYVFLTDHSGVGNSHIKPTTDSYNVETLNDLLVRLFDEFTTVVSCEKKVEKRNLKRVVEMNGWVKSDNSDKEFSCKLYPNPTHGRLNIKIKGDPKILFLTDASGRVLERYNVEGRHKLKVNLTAYPAGTYQITYWGDNKQPVSGQVVLVQD